MKYQEIIDSLIADGYSNHMPPRNPNALMDGADMDRDYANEEIKCHECNGQCHYEPWAQEGSYRSFAVCNDCDEAIEF